MRSAFEDLERTLQYAERRREMDPSDDWEELDEEPSIPDAPETTQPSFDCLEQIKSSAPGEVASALATFNPKTSDNWCQLALLRDELEGANPLAFYETLVEGVRATNSAQSVTALLYEACLETVPEELRLPLLERMHIVCAEGYGTLGVCEEGFFYLTQRLWLDLATSMEFSRVRDSLATANAPRLARRHSRATWGLLIRLLPRLGLRGDPEWVDEATELIDDHYHSLGPGAQNAVLEADWGGTLSGVASLVGQWGIHCVIKSIECW